MTDPIRTMFIYTIPFFIWAGRKRFHAGDVAYLAASFWFLSRDQWGWAAVIAILFFIFTFAAAVASETKIGKTILKDQTND